MANPGPKVNNARKVNAAANPIIPEAPELKAYSESLIVQITGSTLASIIDDLKEANLSAEEKIAFVKVALAAAIGNRATTDSRATTSKAIVLRKKQFILDNDINFTKLAAIGHVCITSNEVGALSTAWQTKLGAKHIWAAGVFNQFSEERNAILTQFRAKVLHTNESAAAILTYFNLTARA